MHRSTVIYPEYIYQQQQQKIQLNSVNTYSVSLKSNPKIYNAHSAIQEIHTHSIPLPEILLNPKRFSQQSTQIKNSRNQA
jgi:hypothetical protein